MNIVIAALLVATLYGACLAVAYYTFKRGRR